MINKIDAGEAETLFNISDAEISDSYLEEESGLELNLYSTPDLVSVNSQIQIESNDQEMTEIVNRRMSDIPRNPITGEIIEDERRLEQKRAARKRNNIRQMQGQLQLLQSRTSLSDEDKKTLLSLNAMITDEKAQLSVLTSG